MERTDSELLAALSSGDRQAFEEIYHRYKKRLYNYCRRMLACDDVAQDVVQHVFVKLLEQHQTIRQPEKLCGWLLTIASNRCHHILSERSRQISESGEETEQPHQAASDCARGVDSHMIARSLSKLPTELREIIVLREYEDLPYREIAEVLQINESTVKFRLHTARKKLCELILTAVKVEERYELR